MALSPALSEALPAPAGDVRARAGILGPGDRAVVERLVHELIVQLFVDGRRPAVTDPLTFAGAMLRGTAWASYRAGRQRVASLAAVYVNWFAPPAPWRLNVERDDSGLVELWWSKRGAQLVDIVRASDRRGPLLDEDLRARIDGCHARAAGAKGYIGVRLIALGAPGLSRLFRPDGSVVEDPAGEVLGG